MPHRAYISVAGEDRISIWSLDPRTGQLQFQEEAPLAGAPGPLAVDPGQRFLYAGLRSTCQIASLRIDQHTGSLSALGTVSLESDPCYLATDRTGRYLLSSYYRAGRVAVQALGENGAVKETPVEWHATAPKAHSIQTDPSNRFAFAPHVGESNRILQFEFDAGTGRLRPNAVPVVIPGQGAGPRHYCFHPCGEYAYFVNEQGCSVTAYHFDSMAGTLEAFQTLSTLPRDFEGENHCAQIHIAPSGRFLYAANRGHDSIACFAIDATSGRLTSLGQQLTEPTPRAFGLDPQGRYLFAAGMGSGRLAAYRIDAQNGALQPLGTYTVGERPMWVLVLNL